MTERKFYYPIGRKKVAIVGAGYVGASIAYALTLRDLAQEIVLIDLDTNKAWGEATDIQHGIPYMGECSVRWASMPTARTVISSSSPQDGTAAPARRA